MVRFYNDFTAGLAAGVVAAVLVLASFFMQHEGVLAMAQAALVSVVAVAFLAFFPLSPSEAVAAEAVKANRARTSRAFFMTTNVVVKETNARKRRLGFGCP